MKISFFLLRLSLVMFCCTEFVFSQKQTPQQYVILGISVEGTHTAEPSALIGNSGFNIGDTISVPGEALRTAAMRLWSLNVFSDVQIFSENIVNDGIYLLIVVEEYPRFERVEITGNDEFDEEDIEKKLEFSKNELLSPQKISKAIKKLKKEYAEKGYNFTEIQSSVEMSDSLARKRAVLKLTIDEGAEVSVEKIDFSGNEQYEDDELKSEFSETNESVWWKFWQSAKFDKKKFEEDKQKLIAFYRKNGFKDFQFLSDSITYLREDETMEIFLNVYEGPQYIVRNISWEGNTVYTNEELNTRLGFNNGDIYNVEKFEQNLRSNQDQTDVASLYLDNGYLMFSAEPEEKKISADSIDITIRVGERNQFMNGDVSIVGNTKTQDNVIRRELYTLPGEKFNRAAIIRSLRQLQQLNYFNPEKLRPDYRLVNNKTVNLFFEVEEKSSDEVNASVGYSEAFGATGAIGFTINNFSLRDPLAGGAGQILNFEWQFGQGNRFRTFSLNFTEPWLYDTPTLVGFSIFDTRQQYVFDLQQTGVSGRIGRRLKWPDDFFRGDWNVRFQQNNVLNGANYYNEGKTTQISLSQAFSRNSTDSPIFPSVGSNFSLSYELSRVVRTFPQSEKTYFQKWIFSGEKYLPLFSTNRVVLYSAMHSGYIVPGENASLVPPIELFFMGGTGIGYFSTTQLRGYDDRTVGPQTSKGQNTGGKIYIKNSIELRFALSINPMPLYFLLFAEGGNVWANSSEVDVFGLKRSAGFGARILVLPIGMLGFDYGYGFDDAYGPKGIPDGKPEKWKFHFVFGRGF